MCEYHFEVEINCCQAISSPRSWSGMLKYFLSASKGFSQETVASKRLWRIEEEIAVFNILLFFLIFSHTDVGK